MTKGIQALRGMNDILPSSTPVWQYVEQILIDVAKRYAYQEIRFPIVEKTELFKRGVGEITDIVEKEMYSFTDRNGDSLSLRPEGTASCVRAVLQHSLLYGQTPRLWYLGPMFRHERPQKGRYRQFHQFSVEAFGIESADIDAEIIAMSARLLQDLGLREHVCLQLNSLGDRAARQAHRQALLDYLMPLKDQLDEDSQRRLTQNPLRILDSKNPQVRALLTEAPKLPDFLSSASSAHFERLCLFLDQLGIAYQLNPNLVRGLDYYTNTVFEWVTDKLGAQATVCAGGRYDNLVEQLGGKPTPAIGFSLGIERLISLLESVGQLPSASTVAQADIYVLIEGEAAQLEAMKQIDSWRDAIPKQRIRMHCGDGSFKSQFKRADKSGAKIVLILAPEELNCNAVTVKYMREDKPQHRLALAEVVAWLQTLTF
ncbi:MAG: histidine--tRNA ligase [Pseudomonadota bacterium]